jgi:hypothetical protein
VLGYAMTQSSRGGGNISKEDAILGAGQIMQYAGQVEQAVNRLRLATGCTDSQISFDNPIVSGYANASAPLDKSCNIYDAMGGGVAFQMPPEKWLDGSQSAQALYGKYYITGSSCINFLGPTGVSDTTNICAIETPRHDLMFTLMYVTSDICAEINRMMRDNKAIPYDVNGTWDIDRPFNGIYSHSTQVRLEQGGAGTSSPTPLPTGCVEGGTAASPFFQPTGTYHFYHVILAR